MKLTKSQLKEIIREELSLINESNIKVELGKMIAALKMKDKSLETVIRTLVFNNPTTFIEKIVKLQMPEFIREYISSLTESFDITKLIKPGTKIKVGFTEIQYTRDKKELVISHGGNMGNSIKDSVNPNLKLRNFPTIEKLKELYPTFTETGSPNYMYTIRFKLM